MAERESETIIAGAYKKSQEIKGEGDAQSTQMLFADAFSASPEFYSFYSRSLEAYKTTFNDKSNMILLEPDSDFLKYFNDTDGVKEEEQLRNTFTCYCFHTNHRRNNTFTIS